MKKSTKKTVVKEKSSEARFDRLVAEGKIKRIDGVNVYCESAINPKAKARIESFVPDEDAPVVLISGRQKEAISVKKARPTKMWLGKLIKGKFGMRRPTRDEQIAEELRLEGCTEIRLGVWVSIGRKICNDPQMTDLYEFTDPKRLLKLVADETSRIHYASAARKGQKFMRFADFYIELFQSKKVKAEVQE